MSQPALRWIVVAAVLGALSVVLGAFAAHGLPNYLEWRGASGEQLARRLANFDTAARYQTYAALFLLGMSLAIDRAPRVAWRVACWSMLVGSLIFAAVLYGVAVATPEWQGLLGPFAPIGGTLMIVAWVAATVGAVGAAVPAE